MGLDANFVRVVGEERTELAYFRKVNWLHRWIEVNCNGGEETNCDDISVSIPELAELSRRCSAVLEDPTKAIDLLPTQERFFFGCTDYDEGYLADVREVREACIRIMDEEAAINGEGPSSIFYWSWW